MHLQGGSLLAERIMVTLSGVLACGWLATIRLHAKATDLLRAMPKTLELHGAFDRKKILMSS